MKSYFYYTKESIENFKTKRQLALMGQEDKILSVEEMEEQGKTELYKDCVIYESDIPLVGYPILDNGKLRQATLVELIDLGEQSLLAGEIINREEETVEYIEQPTWQYKWDFELLKWLPDETLLNDGQYIEGEKIIEVPYNEALGYLIPVWDRETHIWKEEATETDKLQYELNEYLRLNTPLDFEDMETAGVLEDYKTYVREAKEYLTKAVQEVSMLTNIPHPSEKLKEYFDTIKQTAVLTSEKFGGGVLI